MKGIVYDKVCLMLPTYKRSDTLLPIFIKSALDTVSFPRAISFAFCVNSADDATKAFLASYDFQGADYEIFEESLPSPNLAEYFNMLYAKTKTRSEPGTVVTMLGDDMQILTPRWDMKILALTNNYSGVGPFWCNDAYIARERCAVNLFVARDFVEATEHPFMCPEFECEMIDVVWTSVGRYTQTSHFLPDVVIKHNHNTAKPREEWDETFKRLNIIQDQVHQRGGKKRAKEVAWEIASILKAKGLTGDSVC